jgi:TPR repeat protein
MTKTESAGNMVAIQSRSKETTDERFRRCQLEAHDGTNRDAIFQLAQMYEMGKGCPQDYRAAARCYIKLAQEPFQDPPAMYCLGILYMMGDGGGVPIDPDKSFRLWEKAAKLGHGDAREFLKLRELAAE